jgi:3-hydroxyisobutyrate dehydrogenase-like beta-hydroxyacid dehydrogenase
LFAYNPEVEIMTTDRPSIGFAGAGQLGSAMVTRLLAEGFTVGVWNRSPAALEPLADLGAEIAAAPAALARDYDLLMTCVTDAMAVRDIVFGPDGFVGGAREDQLYIDTSTIDATETREMAGTLSRQTGTRWIDAPISGGAAAALIGSMTVMAGGTEADFEKARPIWSALAGQCTLMGPTGAGQSTKMINKVLVLGGFALLAEAAALATNAGIDATRIPGALAGGRADSRLLQEGFPKMINPGGPALGKNSVNVKDLELVHDLARASGTPMPMLAVVTELNRKLIRMGLGDECSTTYIKVLTGE